MLLVSMILALFVFVLLGMDIAFAIGVAALAYIGLSQFDDRPINPVLFVQELTAGVDSFSLLAIPMFIFAGELMTKAGVTRRLIAFAATLVGRRRGGLADVGITGNLFMASISGSAIADAAAVGSILIPEMTKRGYPVRYSAGVISAAACMAPIIPPSIMFILLGSIANLSVGDLFIAGIIPGFLMCIGLLITSRVLARVYKLPMGESFSREEKKRAILEGLLPLGAPVLIIVTKVFGIATPTESAAIVVLYTLVLGVFVYRDLSLPAFFESAMTAAMMTAVVMMTVATSQIFGSLATYAGLGQVADEFLRSISSSPWVILLVINVMLLLLGTVMEPLPIMLILSPILFPLLGSMGVDPIHFGLVMVLNLVLGGVTPPVGLNLFIMARVARIGVMDVFWGGWPHYVVLGLILLLLTYVPAFSLTLVHLLR